MTIEYKVHKNQYSSEVKSPSVSLHETEYLNLRAKFAMDLIARWGMVVASPDGEDTSGRAKLKLEKEKDVVKRASKMTALAFSEFEKNNWVTHLPTLETMNEMVKNKELEEA